MVIRRLAVPFTCHTWSICCDKYIDPSPEVPEAKPSALRVNHISVLNYLTWWKTSPTWVLPEE